MIAILTILAAGIIFIVIATSRLHWHPFLALLVATYFIAIASGIPLRETGGLIAKGFGGTLSSIGIIIIAGTLIGVILEKTGATITISQAILKLVSPKRPAAAMSIIGYIVAIPVFCDAAFVVLSSLNKSLARKTGKSLVPIAIALSTGLYAPHVLVPPTPGPLAAAANLHLDNLGLVIIVGLLVALPVAAVGYLYSIYLSKTFTHYQEPAFEESKETSTMDLPGLGISMAPILLPIILMASGTITSFYLTENTESFWISLLDFLSNPVNALLIGLGSAFFLLPGYNKTTLTDWIDEGLVNAAKILIITGMGGALGSVIQQLPLAEYLSEELGFMQAGLLIPFLIAAVLKTAQGSSTVAIITTSAILYPLLPGMGLDGEMGKTWVIMAIGAGSMTVSHANDSYFWVVSQFSHMDVKTAYRSHTVATFFQGLTGLLAVLLGYSLWH